MEVFGMSNNTSTSRSTSRSPGRFDAGPNIDLNIDVDDPSFDYLRDATKRGPNINSGNGQRNANESISFLLDASAITASTVVDMTANTNATATATANTSLASSKQTKQAFYSLHDTAVSEFLSPRSPSKNRINTNSGNGNGNRYQSKLASPKAKTKSNANVNATGTGTGIQRRLSSLPSLAATQPQKQKQREKQKQSQKQTENNNVHVAPSRPKINTRRSLSSTTSNPNSKSNPNSNSKHQKRATTSTSTSTSAFVSPSPGSARRGAIPQTPGGFWTTNTESKSFVNGLLSPFSPLLHSAVHQHAQNTSSNLATINSFDNEDQHNNSNNNHNTTNNNHNNHNGENDATQRIQDQRKEFLQFVSLQPCRKVSVVVRVTAVDDEDDEAMRCIFPHYKDDLGLASADEHDTATKDATTTTTNFGFATPKGKGTSLLGSPMSLSSPNHNKSNKNNSNNHKLSSPTHRRDVVVVNPTAFGRYIPSQVTMETAKLVAQVANISSEDWARLYEFHHVMWPTPTKSKNASNNTNAIANGGSLRNAEDLSSSYNTIDSLSRAVVQDLLAEHKSSLLISLGHESSCFGTSSYSNPNPADSGSGSGSGNSGHKRIGLWPKIINQCAAMLETRGVVRLTMVEILEPSSGGTKKSNNSNSNNTTTTTADSFRDLLAPSDQKPTSIHLRHTDMKGAVLEGLSEVEIDSMPALLEALALSRQRRAQRRRANNNNNRKGNSSSSSHHQRSSSTATATAVIGTLHYWEHAVSYELHKSSNATVTCVELSSTNSDTKVSGNGKGSGNGTINGNGKGKGSGKTETLESIAHRKSAVSLGQALRQLLLQQAQSTENDTITGLSTSELAPVVSYRETTLTKVLQRSMESSKIVLVASISPLSRDYEHTVFTLNYLRRLLVKPGNTLTSPFGGRNSNTKSTPKTAKTDNRSHLNNTNSSIINNNNNNTSNRSINRSVITSPENKERLSASLAKDPRYVEQLVSDPRQRLAKLFTPSPNRKKTKPWHNVLDRMEDSQKSTRGTPTAISLNSNGYGPDGASTNGSYSANSYAGPRSQSQSQSNSLEELEARQVVESPGSAQQQGQPRQSWQPDEDEDDDVHDDNEDGVKAYEIRYNADVNVNANGNGSDNGSDESGEYDSEEEIERELLMSARLKERSLQTEIEEIESALYPEENFSFEDGEGDDENGDDNKDDDNEDEDDGAEENGDKERSLEAEIEGIESALYPEENFSYDDDEEENGGQQFDNDGVDANPAKAEAELEADGNQAIEVVLQGVHPERNAYVPSGAYYAPETEDVGDSITDGQALEEIVPESSYYDEGEDGEEDHQNTLEYALPEESKQNELEHQIVEDQIADGLPEAPTDLSNMINDHLEEEFARNEDDNIGNVYGEEDDDDDDTLGLQPIAVETVEENEESHTEIDGNRQPLFTGEEWQEGTDHRRNTSHVQDDSIEGLGHQTDYELPEEPLPSRNIVKRINVRSSQPSTPDTSTSRRAASVASPSPYKERQAFNSYASPYSVKLKATKSREYTELTNEREELRTTVVQLKEDLRKVAYDRDSTIEQYETQIQKLYTNLDEAEGAKRELEAVTNQTIHAQTTREREMKDLAAEREQLRLTVESLRQDLAQVSQSHENQLRQHQTEIDDFQSKLNKAVESQKEIEDIADEAVTAHRTQVEDTQVLAAEREDLQVTIEALQSTVQSLERDQGGHVAKYQREIRELHAKLEETRKDKFSLQQEADDARFQLENHAEKVRRLNLEREELHSTVRSVKGSAKKAVGDHNEYLTRFKHEIQQLHTKLDDAHSDKLRVEKAADDIRFAKDDLERRVKSLEDDLASSRSNTLRLEGIRREEQGTIRKMNSELRRKDSEKIDIENFKRELERLKRHKDHLESVVAQRTVESSAGFKQLDEEIAEAKRNNLRLEEELSSVRMELSASLKQNGELEGKLRSTYDANSRLSRQLAEKDESLERLQSSCDNLQSVHNADKGLIAKLNQELQNRESAALDTEQLHHKMSRLRQDRDQLQHLMESRKNEYDRSLEEKTFEISVYASQVETLSKDLDKATAVDKIYRNDAEAQLRSLQASESNLIQNLRQRDDKIDRLQKDMETQSNEITSLREQETSASHAKREVIHLQERLTKLEITLEITTKEREEAVRRVKSESNSHKSILHDLERSRDEVHRYKTIMKDLNTELDQRQEESLEAKERIFQMEATLRAFKKETKERVSTLIDREKDSASVVERTRHENRDLTSNLQNLNGMVERLRRERDICFQSLKDGQQKLSEMSSKNSLVNVEDLLSTPPPQRRSPPSRRREPRTEHRTELRAASRSYHPPMESITARAAARTAPEIFVSGYQLGSPTTLAEERAEEIAFCVAQSAKHSLEENFEEVSQLRSQISRLDNERSEQVSALKCKVRNLENELSYDRVVHRNSNRSIDDENSEQISSLKAKVRNLEKELSYERVGNRTPVMGSSARRSRRQNYFVDWDEKHWN